MLDPRTAKKVSKDIIKMHLANYNAKETQRIHKNHNLHEKNKCCFIQQEYYICQHCQSELVIDGDTGLSGCAFPYCLYIGRNSIKHMPPKEIAQMRAIEARSKKCIKDSK